MLRPVTWITKLRKLLLRVYPTHFSHNASLTVRALCPLLLFHCIWISLKNALLKDIALETFWTCAVFWVGLVPPHLLIHSNTLILRLKQILVHDLPNCWRALRQ